MGTFTHRALGLILRGQPNTTNPDTVRLDYRDPATYSALWLKGLELGEVEIDGQDIDLTDSSQQFLLIGNDPPDGVFDTKIPALAGINFRSHFTATSWLAAWKVKFPEAKAAIAVIDPRPVGMAQGAARALQTILGARDAANQSLVPGAAVLNAPSLIDICQWLAAAKKETRDVAKDAPHLRDLLRSTIWSELTSDREQHHALSNVLGSFLLRAAVGGRKAEGDLQRIQQWLDVLAKVCDVGTGTASIRHGGVQSWVERELGEQFEEAVLIDDMAEIWGGFLATSFGGNPAFLRTTRPGQFADCVAGGEWDLTTDGLSGLPARLAKVISEGRERLCSADMVPKAKGQDGHAASREHFVLFLDLRLGLGAAFHAQLRKVARMLLDSSRNLPWFPTEQDRAAFKAELDDEKAGDTLLPRLVSLIDPTLPVVIFSSTHHTDLIDPFRNYGNIITAFRKPTMAGTAGMQWEVIVSDLRGQFQSAIEQASRVMRIRRAFSKLNSSRRSHTVSGGNALEVFIDESFYRKTNVYSIGGVVLLAESHRRIRDFCMAMEDEGLHWGLSLNNRDSHIRETRRLVWNGKRLECARGWSIDRGSLPQPGSFLKKFADDDEQRSAWNEIQELSAAKGVKVFAVALGTPVTDQIGRELGIPSLQGVARDQADELHRELAKSLLLLLFTAHPEVSAALRAPNASIAIDVGTRTAVPEDYDRRHEETYQKFGLAYTDHGLNNPALRERCEMWNMALDWAQGQNWWNHGQIRAQVVRGRIDPDERDLSEWTNTMIWDPRRKMVSVSSYDGLNYLRETLARLTPTLSPNIVRARGCALFDFEDTRDWMVKLYCFPCFPYQPHYLADWIARCGVQETGDADQKCALQEAFASGFLTDWSASMKELLNAVVDLDGSDTLEGLRALVKWLERRGDSSGGCRATDLLLARSHETAVKADGNILRGLFAGMP